MKVFHASRIALDGSEVHESTTIIIFGIKCRKADFLAVQKTLWLQAGFILEY